MRVRKGRGDYCEEHLEPRDDTAPITAVASSCCRTLKEQEMHDVRTSSLLAYLAALALSLSAAAPALGEDRYVISADGQEVIDKTAHLAWKRCVEGVQWDGHSCKGKPKLFKLPAARAYVAELDTTKAWRIPTRDELSTLVVKNKRRPMIDQTLFPNTPATQTWATRPGFEDDLNAWLVHFGNGRVYGNTGARKFGLRLVRSVS